MSGTVVVGSGLGPESGADTASILADLCQRVAALERRVIKRRPAPHARRRTRVSHVPYGWRVSPRNTAVLIQDDGEQRVIFRIVEMFQNPALSLRESCRQLDALGYKRRGGKRWVGAHSLVREILRREDVLTPEGARSAVARRIEDMKRRAGDKYRPEFLSDDEARARARG